MINFTEKSGDSESDPTRFVAADANEIKSEHNSLESAHNALNTAHAALQADHDTLAAEALRTGTALHGWQESVNVLGDITLDSSYFGKTLLVWSPTDDAQTITVPNDLNPPNGASIQIWYLGTDVLTIREQGGGDASVVQGTPAHTTLSSPFTSHHTDAKFALTHWKNNIWFLEGDTVEAPQFIRPGDASHHSRAIYPTEITANGNLSTSHSGYDLLVNHGSQVTLTVPPDTSGNHPIGTEIGIWQMGAGDVAIAPGAGVTVHTPASDGLLKVGAQYGVMTIKKLAANTWVLQGNRKA